MCYESVSVFLFIVLMLFIQQKTNKEIVRMIKELDKKVENHWRANEYYRWKEKAASRDPI